MEKQTKIAILWVAVMCGLIVHSLADLMPIFWAQDVAVSQEGVAPKGLLMFMMVMTYAIPAIGVLCALFWNTRPGKIVNALLTTIMALFNIAHSFELVDFDPVQLPLLPVILVVSIVLCLMSWRLLLKEKNSNCCK